MEKYFLSAVLTVMFAVPALAQKAPNSDREIRDLIRKLADAQLAFDARALESIFTPDYVEISPAGDFDERSKVLGFYKPELKPDPSKLPAAVDLAEESIRYFGNVAVMIVRMNYSVTADGRSAPPRSMRVTFVCVRDGSGWKIASAHYTGIRPAPAPKTN